MENMENMHTRTSAAFVLLRHRNKGTCVLFRPSIGLGFNREQQKHFAEPDINSPELIKAFRDSMRAGEPPFLAVGLNDIFLLSRLSPTFRV
jgi:hypothetical protein